MKRYIIILMLLAVALLGAQEAEVTPSVDFYAADQSVFILPTAHTMPAGSHALTSFEIFLLQYSYSATDRLHLSAGMVFPITIDMFDTFSFGAKYRFFSRNKTSSAAWASLSPEPMVMTAGNVISYGTKSASLHLAGAVVAQLEEGEQRYFFGLGGIKSLSQRTNFMAELLLFPETDWIEDEETVTSYGQAAIVGFRFKGERISWDLGGMRMISEDMGDLIAIPFLKATFLF